MSTHKETVAHILETLEGQQGGVFDVGSRKPHIFTARAMFGEYALYCDGKVVALICDDLLYVKIVPSSSELESMCEKDSPYTGAKLHYVVEEEQIRSIKNLSEILQLLSASLPKPKPKKKKQAV